MLQRFELDPTKKGTAYSKGNRCWSRRWLATWNSSSSTSQPSGWILMEEVFAECIQAERQRGRTVFLSSHILSEVEALCDRVSIIRNGRNVETGTLAEMRHVTDTSVDVTLNSAPPALAACRGSALWRSTGTDCVARCPRSGSVRCSPSSGRTGSPR